jgi:hypothetical protein
MIERNKLQVNGDKSSFCAIEAKFLGFLLSQQGVKPQVKKVKAIVMIATPKTVKQVHSFIAMIHYYKGHIPCCSNLLTPLTALTKIGADSSGWMIVNTALMNSNAFWPNKWSLLILTSLFHLKSTWMHQTNKLDQ